MSGQIRRFVVLAGAAACLGGGTAMAQTADESRAYVAELMADAGERTSLLQSGTAGHDGSGFFLADAEGNNRLNIGGAAQFRYYANFRDDGSNNDDFESGFQTRRTQLFAAGNIVNPDLTFRIQSNVDFDGGGFFLEDAYAKYALGNGWAVGAGQFKTPLLREDMVSDWYQLAVDRSVTGETFRPDRTQGIWAEYGSDAIRFWLSFNDGANTDNTDFTASNDGDYAFTGRLEWLVSGAWEQFQDFTSWRESDFGFMVGGGAHYQEDPNTTNTGNETDLKLFLATIDASLEGNGFNIFAAGILQWSEVGDLTGDNDFLDFGGLVQGGFFFTDAIEAFARYDIVVPDSDRSGDDAFNTITGGVNWYPVARSHAVKGTLDVQYNIDNQSDTDLVSPNTGIGLLPDADEGQFAIRAQLQWLF